ncbi:MAG TPA: hypothetical protein PLB38_01315, partial [bacterium]|nr:hypothetical protein [bacterium]
VVVKTENVPGPTKTVEKTVEVKTPPVKKVHRPSRPAAEKEITFEAKDLVHVWNGPVDHLLDKDDD